MKNVYSLSEAQGIAQNVLGSMDWEQPIKGFCKCPGDHLHTTDSGGKDCAVFLDKVPTIHCLHQSCKEIVAEANKSLRRALAGGSSATADYKHTGEMGSHAAAKRREQTLAARAEASLARILEQNRWPLQAIMEESPFDLSIETPQNGWRYIVSLFQPNDLIWIGNKRHSGPRFSRNFRTREEWLGDLFGNYELTCPSAFKVGTCHRKNEYVATRRFLVVESDVIDKERVGAIFKWLSKCVGMMLRAVVDTAGKSLHGWFEFPPEEILKELRVILPALQCDPGMFTSSQPCRLPGMLRNGKLQTLIYLNP